MKEVERSKNSDNKAWLNKETYSEVTKEINKWPKWKQNIYGSLIGENMRQNIKRI